MGHRGGGGENGESLLGGCRVLVWGEERFWRWTVYNMSLVPLNATEKWSKTVNFMWGCVFTTVL